MLTSLHPPLEGSWKLSGSRSRDKRKLLMLHYKFPTRRAETLRKSVKVLCRHERLEDWAGSTSLSNTSFVFENDGTFQFRLQRGLLSRGQWTLDPSFALSLRAEGSPQNKFFWPTEKHTPLLLQSDGLRLYLRTPRDFLCFHRDLSERPAEPEVPHEALYRLLRSLLSLPPERSWLLLLGWLEHWLSGETYEQALAYLLPHLDSWAEERRVVPWHFLRLTHSARGATERKPLLRLARTLSIPMGGELSLVDLSKLEGLKGLTRLELGIPHTEAQEELSSLRNAPFGEALEALTLRSDSATGDELLGLLEGLSGEPSWLPNLRSLTLEGSKPPSAARLLRCSQLPVLHDSLRAQLRALAGGEVGSSGRESR